MRTRTVFNPVPILIFVVFGLSRGIAFSAEEDELVSRCAGDVCGQFGCAEQALVDTYALSGGSVTPDTIRLLSDSQKTSHTVKDVEMMGSVLGMDLQSFMATRETLKGARTPYIAHLKTNHFITIISTTTDGVKVIDRGTSPNWYSWWEFEVIWSGVIIVPQNCISQASTDDLAFESSAKYLGEVAAQFTSDRSLFLKNTGDREIQILSFSTTGGGRPVTPTEGVSIGPQSKQRITIRLSPGNRPGFRRFFLEAVGDKNERKCYFYGIYFTAEVVRVAPPVLRITPQDSKQRLLGNTLYIHLFGDTPTSKADVHLTGLPDLRIDRQWGKNDHSAEDQCPDQTGGAPSTLEVRLVPGDSFQQETKMKGFLEIRLGCLPENRKRVPVYVLPEIWP